MNKQLKLAKRPEGMPDADTWNLENNPIPESRKSSDYPCKYSIVHVC